MVQRIYRYTKGMRNPLLPVPPRDFHHSNLFFCGLGTSTRGKGPVRLTPDEYVDAAWCKDGANYSVGILWLVGL
jgi:hypothetical protein